jgi:hypothetical protein
MNAASRHVTVMLALASLVSVAGCRSSVAPDEARAIAQEAYEFTYPLVMNYRTMYLQAIEGDGEFGKWLHLGLSSPADTAIVTPNNDTPYSYAWVDLRAEPWVLTMPEVEPERFYTSQWDDLWGYVLDNAGSVNDGNAGVSVLLASPSWSGDLPNGVDRVIQGESDFLGALTRTEVTGRRDESRVREIQQSYRLQPLSAYAGTDSPPAASPVDWPGWTDGDDATEKYWSYASFLLPFTAPNPDDQAVYERMAKIGLRRGARWDPAALDPAVRQAIQEGLDSARARMAELSKGEVDAASLFGPRERIGTHYEHRALGVYMGIFGNVPEQSVYLSMPADSAGDPLDGSVASYMLTFPAEQLPPVKYFWSITMYKLPQRWLIENPIDRYSIGTNTPALKRNVDGSLTIYVSRDRPIDGLASNWLPAPDGPFWTVMRCYGPSEEIISGAYQLPGYVGQRLMP